MSTVNNMQIQDDEGNVFHPETSIEQIVGENGTQGGFRAVSPETWSQVI